MLHEAQINISTQKFLSLKQNKKLTVKSKHLSVSKDHDKSALTIQ